MGEGVTEFSVGDHVVSTFFPDWVDGEARVEGFGRVPGDGIDGYAREQVTAPAQAFTLAPRGWSHAEAATLTTAGLTAWRAAAGAGRAGAGQRRGVGVCAWGMTVRKLTGGRGVDHVIGVLTGIEPKLPLGLALSRHLRLHAFVVGSRSDQQAMVRALEASSMRPVIDRHFPLEELADAFRYQASGKHFGKIVIDI